jgi:hypothetical protein
LSAVITPLELILDEAVIAPFVNIEGVAVGLPKFIVPVEDISRNKVPTSLSSIKANLLFTL